MNGFRPVPESDRAEVRRILRYAFAPERGPVTDDPDGEWPPTLFDQRGLYDDGDLVSVCKLYSPAARVRGAFRRIGGLGAVATPPEHRRRGHVRELCRNALTEYHERGVGLVALWPFSTPFYGRLGWGTANQYARYDLPPAALPRHDADGRLGPLEADDWRRMRRVETAYGEGTSLSLRRSEAWWRERTLADWDGGGTPYCYGYERDGTLAGYVLYTVGDDATRTLSVDDLVYADEEAHRALLDFLGTHGAQIERILLRRATDSDLLARVTDPADVECTIRAGPMVRLSAVTRLADLDWPDAELRCTLAVDDPLLARNDRHFDLRATAGTLGVEPAGDGAGGDPDASVDVGTLSQLTVGTHGVDVAERLAGLEVRNESIREPLSDLFRSRSVRLREFF